ncbi:hypothetical protein BST61_g11501 [Cercospora zeina]
MSLGHSIIIWPTDLSNRCKDIDGSYGIDAEKGELYLANNIQYSGELNMPQKLHIDNTQYSLLEASENFIWHHGLGQHHLQHRINHSCFSHHGPQLQIDCRVMIIQALGDISTQVAQYRIFNFSFAPSDGFASTLGLELVNGELGSFVRTATANPIVENTGNFCWVYWTAVFMNLLSNAFTVIFWYFQKHCDRKYSDGINDPATGEELKEKDEEV